MFQQILESEKSNDIWIHTLKGGALISGFQVDLFDSEVKGIESFEAAVRELLRSLPEGLTVKFYLRAEYKNESPNDHSRVAAICNVGFISQTAFVVFERFPGIDLNFLTLKKDVIQKDYQAFTKDLNIKVLEDAGLAVKSLNGSELKEVLPKLQEELSHDFQSIDLGEEVVSVLRLNRQSEFGIDPMTLSQVKDLIPLPYTICCSVEALPQAASETMLRRRSKQTALESDVKESRKFSEAQNDLEDISLNGARLFKMEWLCLLNRKSEDWLRTDREEAKRRLGALGDMYIESVGAFNTLKSMYPGERQHLALIEKDEVLPSYIPLLTNGDSKRLETVNKRSLIVHRRDESLTAIDVFDSKYESFSWCIFGRPGTGKSVLVNAFTRAICHDPEISVIKIDVGSSHTRETEMLGGVEKTLSLNEPTGINPFDILSELGPTKEAIQILSSFLEVLILEEGEAKLSKALKSDVEKWIQFYSESVKHNPSLSSFYKQVQDFPRRQLLSRWVGSGVYGNAFQVTNAKPIDLKNHLTYFNFSKISQAQDPDYAQGGLAAVMAQFNYLMLKKSEHKKRIVFIADETPFFIQKCFNFFNLSIANIRKEGHGFITVAQKSSHVVVNGDTGILDNSPNKIFFSQDGDYQSFCARTQLSACAIEKIKSLQRRNGEFSEAFLKDGKGERVIKIRLNHEEYWSYTSKDEDKRKFEELRSACPSLSLEEVIRCLSLS